MEKTAKIYVAGSGGMVGSAVVRLLRAKGYENIIERTRAELDLCDQGAAREFFEAERPAYVFMAAAKVGGIRANSLYKAQFIYENLAMTTNVIHSAWLAKAKKLIFLGSSCIYPRLAPQPISEEALLTGPLEETNDCYALAKISGIKLCQAYRAQYGFDAISAMPTNLYGPGDNFHPENSHVLPALLRRFHEAKEQNREQVTVWGTGSPLREFMHVDDLADACLFLMNNYSESLHINVGVGKEISIRDLAALVADAVGYRGKINFDASKPDGTPRKILNVQRLTELGWKPKINFKRGVAETYEWYKAQTRLRGRD